MLNPLTDHSWSSDLAHGEGRADPRRCALPERADLGADEAARRTAWRRKLMSAQPAAEVEAIRRSLHGRQPYADPSWIELMGEKLGEPRECRPPDA